MLPILTVLEDVAPCLTRDDYQKLCCTCSLLRDYRRITNTTRTPFTPETLSCLFQTNLTSKLASVLVQCKRVPRKRPNLRMHGDHLRSLLVDLVLVGLRFRPSCLVDSMSLEPSQVNELLNEFRTNEQWHVYGLQHLRALDLDGNIFFVHPHEFIQRKLLDIASHLANVTVINVSSYLKQPELLSSSRQLAPLRLALVSIVMQLLALKESLVVSIDLKHDVSLTAIAGSILCYPAVYYIESNKYQAAMDNCLGLCPLHVFHTSVSIQSQTYIIDEFSIPKHIISSPIALHCMKTMYRYHLQRIINKSPLYATIFVTSTERTLSRVVL